MYFKKLGDCLVSPVWGIFKDLIGSWHMMEQMRFSCYNKIEKKITAQCIKGKTYFAQCQDIKAESGPRRLVCRVQLSFDDIGSPYGLW